MTNKKCDQQIVIYLEKPCVLIIYIYIQGQILSALFRGCIQVKLVCKCLRWFDFFAYFNTIMNDFLIYLPFIYLFILLGRGLHNPSIIDFFE